MNYFIDTEFIEGTQKTLLGKTKPTIDLISIGIVSEDNRTYYAISKDFNLKEAWNRHDLLEANTNKNHSLNDVKVYWIRENILKPIFDEWKLNTNAKIVRLGLPVSLNEMKFNYKNFKYCIKTIGKSNSHIASDIIDFTKVHVDEYSKYPADDNIQFYAYYAGYDWVAFCWLFGKMLTLPKGFPWYCRDIKQMVDEKVERTAKLHGTNYSLIDLKSIATYPKEVNAHNALADAIWNKQLYEFLKMI